MRITEVEKSPEDIIEKSPEDIKADQEAREAKRQADEKQKRADITITPVSDPNSTWEPGQGTDPNPEGFTPDQLKRIQYWKEVDQRKKDLWTDRSIKARGGEGGARSISPSLDAERRTDVGGVARKTYPAELPKPKYRKAERFSKTVLNNPNSVLQFDVPGYRTGTVGKPGTIQEKWQQFKTQSVKEKAPPGDKYERMIKDIKKGYAKDGKLTDTERGIAYATAWKLYNKRKGKKS